MKLQLPPTQRALLQELIARAPVEKRARILEVRVAEPNNNETQASCLVAVTPHRAESSVSLVMTLGALSGHLFIAAVDESPDEVADVMATIESYDARRKRLEPNDCVPIGHQFLHGKGRVAAQILEIEEEGPLKGIPRILEVNDKKYHCLWVVFLSPEEYALRMREGTIGLVEAFERTGRDMVRLDPRGQSAGDE